MNDSDAFHTRASACRWQRLSTLLTTLERCVEASARLDALVPTVPGARGRTRSEPPYAVLDARVDTLTAAIGAEVSRVSQELLRMELHRKQQQGC